MSCVRCRREIIAGHFDERWDSSSCNEMCDHCQGGSQPFEEMNIAQYLAVLGRIFERAEQEETRLTGSWIYIFYLPFLLLKPYGDFYSSIYSTETHWSLAQRWPYQSSSAWHKVSCKTASWCMRIDSGFSRPRRLPQRRFSLHTIQHYQLSPLRFGVFFYSQFQFPSLELIDDFAHFFIFIYTVRNSLRWSQVTPTRQYYLQGSFFHILSEWAH